MSAVGLPACPACGASSGWVIDSPVSATDRVEVDANGVRVIGLVVPDDGLEPLGHPAIWCAACEAIAIGEGLRDAVLGAAMARSTTH
ncbi:MAG: hypothetical protein L0221_17815 [Chloroflexi bacterium]|nr:hypothetical protein [Chloroflexota bacterium]